MLRKAGQNFTPFNKVRPTRGFTREKLTINKEDVVLWDLSGDKNYRGIWSNYIKKADLVLFLIDGSNTNEEYVEEVRKILERFKDILGSNTIILFNKNDKKEFSIVRFLDGIRESQLLNSLSTIAEINVLEDDLLDRLFAVVSTLKR